MASIKTKLKALGATAVSLIVILLMVITIVHVIGVAVFIIAVLLGCLGYALKELYHLFLEQFE